MSKPGSTPPKVTPDGADGYLGQRVLDRDGLKVGTVIGMAYRHCGCGSNRRLTTRWPDGKLTYLCPKGLKRVEGDPDLQIA